MLLRLRWVMLQAITRGYCERTIDSALELNPQCDERIQTGGSRQEGENPSSDMRRVELNSNERNPTKKCTVNPGRATILQRPNRKAGPSRYPNQWKRHRHPRHHTMVC